MMVEDLIFAIDTGNAITSEQHIQFLIKKNEGALISKMVTDSLVGLIKSENNELINVIVKYAPYFNLTSGFIHLAITYRKKDVLINILKNSHSLANLAHLLRYSAAFGYLEMIQYLLENKQFKKHTIMECDKWILEIIYQNEQRTILEYLLKFKEGLPMFELFAPANGVTIDSILSLLETTPIDFIKDYKDNALKTHILSSVSS